VRSAALELDDAEPGVADLGVLVVGGAAGGEHAPVRQEGVVGAEQRAVARRLVVLARDQRLPLVAVRVGAAVGRRRHAPLERAARDVEQPALVAPRHAAVLRDQRELDALGALERVPVHDPAVRQHAHAAGGRLADRDAVLVDDAALLRRHTADRGLRERLAEAAGLRRVARGGQSGQRIAQRHLAVVCRGGRRGDQAEHDEGDNPRSPQGSPESRLAGGDATTRARASRRRAPASAPPPARTGRSPSGYPGS
jgi:hypothetical protein